MGLVRLSLDLRWSCVVDFRKIGRQDGPCDTNVLKSKLALKNIATGQVSGALTNFHLKNLGQIISEKVAVMLNEFIGLQLMPRLPYSLKIIWEEIEGTGVHVLKFCGGGASKSLVAGFDLDGAVSEPKSGETTDDGQELQSLLNDKLINQIRHTFVSGFKFVMFSNQMGVKTGKTSLAEVKSRMERIANEVGVPSLAFIATEANQYKKPDIGMWTLFTSKYNGDLIVDIAESMFAGDDADKEFVQKIGLTFYRLDEFVVEDGDDWL
jgi:DNA 3'-phosphatase